MKGTPISLIHPTISLSRYFGCQSTLWWCWRGSAYQHEPVTFFLLLFAILLLHIGHYAHARIVRHGVCLVCVETWWFRSWKLSQTELEGGTVYFRCNVNTGAIGRTPVRRQNTW